MIIVQRGWLILEPICFPPIRSFCLKYYKTFKVLYLVNPVILQPDFSYHTDERHVLNVIVVSPNASSIAYLNWNDRLWRKDINITYYMVTLNDDGKLQHKYYDAYPNVSTVYA